MVVVVVSGKVYNDEDEDGGGVGVDIVGVGVGVGRGWYTLPLVRRLSNNERVNFGSTTPSAFVFVFADALLPLLLLAVVVVVVGAAVNAAALLFIVVVVVAVVANGSCSSRC